MGNYLNQLKMFLFQTFETALKLFTPNVMTLRKAYKPFSYPTLFQRWDTHEHSHWLPSETSLHDDITDFHSLENAQQDFIENIFKFFTQGDIDVANGYTKHFIPVFQQTEIKMMLMSFAAREAIHIHGYSLLIETLGLGSETYSIFLKFKPLMDKHDYLNKHHFARRPWSWLFHRIDLEELLVKIAVFSGFVEGMQLFSSFVMLLNFPRHGKMKGMGAIVEWSVADEIQHTKGMMSLFNILMDECKHVVRVGMIQERIYEIAQEMVDLEDCFIDMVFGENDEMLNLSKVDVKSFIRFICDLRLKDMSMSPIFGQHNDPIPWFFEAIKSTAHQNFFESPNTEYSVATATGDWSSVFKTNKKEI